MMATAAAYGSVVVPFVAIWCLLGSVAVFLLAQWFYGKVRK